MSTLDNNNPHRLRIISTPGNTSGHFVAIEDIDTGEKIDHVYHIDITLDAGQHNTATLYYYVADESKHLVLGDDDKPITKQITTEYPEIDVTVFGQVTERKPAHEQ